MGVFLYPELFLVIRTLILLRVPMHACHAGLFEALLSFDVLMIFNARFAAQLSGINVLIALEFFSIRFKHLPGYELCRSWS